MHNKKQHLFLPRESEGPWHRHEPPAITKVIMGVRNPVTLLVDTPMVFRSSCLDATRPSQSPKRTRILFYA